MLALGESEVDLVEIPEGGIVEGPCEGPVGSLYECLAKRCGHALGAESAGGLCMRLSHTEKD